MENPKPPEPRTRRACKDKAEAEKLEEQRILDEFPYVLMVGRNEEMRQREVDNVNDERRRELDDHHSSKRKLWMRRKGNRS